MQKAKHQHTESQKENFSVFSQKPKTPEKKEVAPIEVLKESMSLENEEDNKLKALNDLLKERR